MATSSLVGVSLIEYAGIKSNSASNITKVINKWNADVGVPMGGNVQKRYGGPQSANNPIGEMPGPTQDSQNLKQLGAAGVKILFSYKPALDPTGNYSPNGKV